MKNTAISLTELIRNVSNELRKAAKLNEKENAVMKFTECELELQVNITVDGKAGLKLWVVDLEGGIQKNNSHTIKVKFNSLDNNVILYSTKRKEGSKPIKKQ